jgi:uncharacterized protein (DUF305 family)
VRTASARIALIVLLLASGCSAQPEAGPARSTSGAAQGETGAAPPGAAGFTDTDVMFLQMGLAQIAEGDQLAELAEQRATDPRIRTLATELRAQWREESGTMRRWLLGWQQPLTADPSSGAHAGHGELHMLRPSDLAELRASEDFDGTAVTLLLGHLGNCVETSRMESTGGAYPPARAQADAMTERRQAQVRTLLQLAAQG